MPNDAHRAIGGVNADSKLPDSVYQNIARQIHDGACVLFLGPNVIGAKQPDDSYLPLTELCAAELAQKAGLTLPQTESSSLYHVASSLRFRNLLSDTMIIGAVQEFYKKAEREAQLNPLLEQLADLPFRIVVNTTPDDFFARYYDQAVRPYRFDYYNFRKPAPDPLYRFDEEQAPLIYNLFGVYTKPESLVLTYGDQLGYVNKITGAQHERVPDSLLAAFSTPRFYLFMGFDFEEWSMRVLLDAIFRNARNSIQPFAYPIKGRNAAGPQARVFFQGEFRMEFPSEDMEVFIQNLMHHYNAIDGLAETGAAEPVADALLLHNEQTDDDTCKALVKHMRTLRLRVHTLGEALGADDQTQWLREKMNTVQVVMPLISADFFAEGRPYLPLLEELVKRNDPRNRFLVMPIVVKPFSLEGTPLGPLKTTRPLLKKAVYGEGQEEKHLNEIAETLRKYIASLT
ncbi:MAG: SIR2 family protein [Saprospiraceae bacterium]